MSLPLRMDTRSESKMESNLKQGKEKGEEYFNNVWLPILKTRGIYGKWTASEGSNKNIIHDDKRITSGPDFSIEFNGNNLGVAIQTVGDFKNKYLHIRGDEKAYNRIRSGECILIQFLLNSNQYIILDRNSIGYFNRQGFPGTNGLKYGHRFYIKDHQVLMENDALDKVESLMKENIAHPETTMKIFINCDGSLSPNEIGSPACWAFIVHDETGQRIFSHYGCLGTKQTHNFAEYFAIYMALRFALEHGGEYVIRSDSKLAIDQLKGSANCQAGTLVEINRACLKLLDSFDHKSKPQLVFIPREKNVVADTLCKKAHDYFLKSKHVKALSLSAWYIENFKLLPD